MSTVGEFCDGGNFGEGKAGRIGDIENAILGVIGRFLSQAVGVKGESGERGVGPEARER